MTLLLTVTEPGTTVPLTRTLLVPAVSSADEGRRDRRGEQQQRQHRPMRHRYPVYVPPPIYYPHYESPGIRIVIPFDLR